VKLILAVHFADHYPDVLPDLTLKAVEGHLSDDEAHSILEDLYTVVRLCSLASGLTR
jgi:hypothetical protein